MLPPLATLKEEHPVYTLPTSRERYGHGEYPSLSSRPMSTKASVATIASIFSMKSGSVGYDPQNSLSYGYSRSHTPSASISSTLPYSNSQSRSGSLSVNIGRRTQSSSSGSSDLRRGHAPSSSVSSMHSQPPVDLRGLSASRYQGSQSGVTKMQSHVPSRTKYDTHVQTRLHKAPSTEELSLGLRAYAGNPYVIAVQAELEGKASKYEVSSKTVHDDDELVFDIRRDDVATSDEDEQLPDEILAGWKLYDSKTKTKEAGGVEVFEPRSSAGTLRPFAQERQLQSGSGGLLSGTNVGLPRVSQDGVSTLVQTRTSGYGDSGRGGAGRGWEGSGGYSGGYTNGYGRRNDSSGSDYGGEQGGAPGGGRRGRDNSRGDDGKWQRERPSVSNSSTSESESESESESSEDDYGEEKPSFVRQSTATHVSPALATPAPAHSVHVQRQEEPSSPAIFSQLRNGRRGVYRPPTTSIANDGSGTRPPTAEDDDVPLAQRPGALKAQKTIRERVKSDRDRRRRERSVAPTSRTSRAPEGTISPPPQYVPGDKQEERGRTILARMPKSAPIGGSAAPLSSSQEAAMMAQKVVPFQHAINIPRRHRAKTLNGTDGSGVPADDLAKRLLKVQSRDADVLMPTHRTPAGSTTQPQAGAYAHDVITGERPSVIHASSRRSPRSPQVGSQPFQTQQNPADVPAPTRTLRTMRSFHGISSAATTAAPEPAPPIPAPLGRRSTTSKGGEVNATSDGLMRSKSLKSARTPADKTRRTSAEEAQVLHSHPPVPPAPANRHNLVQMRVFIGDMQRFNMVEAGLDTSAKDVIDMLRHQGDLRNEEHRSRGWTLYEVCQDFGMGECMWQAVFIN